MSERLLGILIDAFPKILIPGLTVARQAILPVLLALALRPFGRLELIWAAFVLAELLGLPLAAAFWSRAYRKIPD